MKASVPRIAVSSLISGINKDVHVPVLCRELEAPERNSRGNIRKHRYPETEKQTNGDMETRPEGEI